MKNPYKEGTPEFARVEELYALLQGGKIDKPEFTVRVLAIGQDWSEKKIVRKIRLRRAGRGVYKVVKVGADVASVVLPGWVTKALTVADKVDGDL